MLPLKRMGVNKSKSSGTFKHNVRTTKAANMAIGPMRGGWRL